MHSIVIELQLTEESKTNIDNLLTNTNQDETRYFDKILKIIPYISLNETTDTQN